MAPEIWSCVNKYDRFKADVYALGVTFYIMSQGKHPWSFRNNFKSLVFAGCYEPPVGIDPQFERMIHNMMSFNPLERNNFSELIQNPFLKNESRNNEAKKRYYYFVIIEIKRQFKDTNYLLAALTKINSINSMFESKIK
jgi:serine/threonine protein kinase